MTGWNKFNDSSMTLREVRNYLRKLALEPTRSLGQNFLHDQNLARWMVSKLSLDHRDHVVELGPGLGALTEYLMQAGVGRITVVEKDGRLASALVQRLGNALHVVQEDAARVDLLRFYGFGRVKVIGNLPYYVVSPILMRFLNKLSPATRLVFAVQRELAQRLVAAPRTREYGIMTVCIQHRWKIQPLRNLSPGVFYPKPRVDSSIILFTPREVVSLCDEVLFEKIVYLGFSERRKQLRKLLGDTKGVWEEFSEEMGISPLARAEELSHTDYAELAFRLSPFRPQTMAARAEELDVVDFQNRVVNRIPRLEAHTEELPHRSVHILIQNRVGKWFLQRRSVWKDSNPGKWDSSVAGHLQSGEDYEIAARRELCEELGVTRCDCLGKKGSLPASAETGWEFIEVFYTQQEGPFVLMPIETDTGAFFEEETIRRWIQKEPESFTPTFLQCFDLVVNSH